MKWSENYDVYVEFFVSVLLFFYFDEIFIIGVGFLFEDLRKEDVILCLFLKLEMMGLCVEN